MCTRSFPITLSYFKPKAGTGKSIYELPLRKGDELRVHGKDFPSGTVVKNLPANSGDTGSIPDPGRSYMPQGN